MEEDFDLTKERECFSCFCDLHMSVACCKCSSDQFACLKHRTLLCSCGKDDRFVLVRYTMDELNTLIEALEGKLVPLEAWALADQGSVGINCEDNISGIFHSKKNDGPACSSKIKEIFEKDTANLCKFGSASASSASHVFPDNVNSSSTIDVADCYAFSGKTSSGFEMLGPSPNLGIPRNSSSSTEVVDRFDIKDNQSVKVVQGVNDNVTKDC